MTVTHSSTEPETLMPVVISNPNKPLGWYEYQIRDCYRELCNQYGKGGARKRLNEIADTTEERMK